MRLINADALIEILKRNKQFFIDAWGGSFHAMSEKDKARCDEIDNCIAEILTAPTTELNGDTISRQAAVLTITGEPPEAHYPSWYAERIKSLPSAPDSRRHGEWVYHKNTMSCVRWSKWECSVCHKKQEYKTDFCPSCGADMRGEEE